MENLISYGEYHHNGAFLIEEAPHMHTQMIHDVRCLQYLCSAQFMLRVFIALFLSRRLKEASAQLGLVSRRK